MNIRRRNPFTMVELMMVVLVIGILAGIGFGTYTYAMNAAKEGATRATIKKIEVALESLKTKHGVYLPQAGDYRIHIDATDKLLTTDHPNVGAIPNYQRDFRKAVDAEGLTIENNIVVDAWGNPIYYVQPGIVNTNSFDLYSLGRDGKFQSTTGDTFATTYTRASFDTCDDLIQSNNQ